VYWDSAFKTTMRPGGQLAALIGFRTLL